MHLLRLTTSLQQAGLGTGEDKGLARKCSGTVDDKTCRIYRNGCRSFGIYIFVLFPPPNFKAARFGSLLCFSLQVKKHLDPLERAILSKFAHWMKTARCEGSTTFGAYFPEDGSTAAPIGAFFNSLTPNDPYRGRTAPLASKRCILYIYSTNIGTEYFKHGI